MKQLILLITTIGLTFFVSCTTKDTSTTDNKLPEKLIDRIQLVDLEGNNIDLKQYQGKTIFLNYWATWCKPCRDEMPSMEALNKAMAGQPFQMLSIVFNDDLDMANSFARRLGATFPVLANPGSELTEAYMITGVPETFLIDADGILRHKFIGPYNWDTWEMRNLVQELFNTTK